MSLELFSANSFLNFIGTSDRENDGLNGPVRRVKTETAKIATRNGQPAETSRVVIETASYDYKGGKTDNAYFLAAAGTALTGKEVYKHDARGNVTEMIVYNTDGSILSKEIYSYEFDTFGNWVKMTTSVAVVENGKLNFEPTEVTYRTITYYLEESVNKSLQVAANNVSNNNVNASAKPSAPPAANSNVKAVSLSAPLTQAKLETAMPLLPSNANTRNASAKENSTVKIDDADAPVRKVANTNSNAVGSNISVENNAVPKPLLRPISGGVLNGKAKSLPSPLYPEMARRARVSGSVTVEVVIDVSGKITSAQAVSGPVMLRQAAEQAARQAHFEPKMLSGQPVKVSGSINYNFSAQ
ncbi:MAG: hypothetical protein NVSMB56_13720 [Pyrinomonadaceae bacterium]